MVTSESLGNTSSGRLLGRSSSKDRSVLLFVFSLTGEDDDDFQCVIEGGETEADVRVGRGSDPLATT